MKSIMKHNKKASLLDPIIWIIIAFIVLVFFGTWIFAHNTLTAKLMEVGTVNNINVTDATVKTFQQVDSALGSLKFVAFVIIVSLILSIFISNIFIKAHPAFYIAYIFIAIVAVILAAIVANAYEDLLLNSVIGDTLLTFKAGNFIMFNLPTWATIVAVFGAVFLFAGVLRDRGLGGGLT